MKLLIILSLYANLAAVPMCDSERKTLIEVAEIVEQKYVIEEKAIMTAEVLRKYAGAENLESSCSPKDEFSSFINSILRDTSADRHFYFEAISNNDDGDWIANWINAGKENGYGVRRVEILEGNIGLIKISSFYELELAFERISAAFDVTSDTSGLILDFRGNGGGSLETERPLLWTFLDPQSESPLLTYSRDGGTKVTEKPPVLWKHYGTDRPLVILVDRHTFSAPEAIAYILQSVDRATIIGERTGGGAHMLGEGVDVFGGYKLHTPETRPLSTKTGANWEVVGVTPDIETTSTQALSFALKSIRDSLNHSK